MAGTTPKYGFPYPTGSDRVADGDNAIQALAERIELINSTSRAWFGIRGASNGIPASTWTASHNLTLAGAPVGAVVAVNSVCVFTATGAQHGYQRIAGSGLTVNGQAAPPTYIEAGGFVTHSCVGLVTVTTANPVITIEVLISGAGGQVDTQSHLIAWRVV